MAGSLFENYGPRDLRDLIEAYPLAWLRAQSGEASLLPLIGVFDGEGQLTELIGHFGLSNPLHAALLADTRGSILFSGPQAYVSPAHAGRRNWAPTWNYAQVRIEAEIAIEPDLTPVALDMLIEQVERDKVKPWAVGELGERFEQLARHIVGFRVRPFLVKGRFKLGQDEDLPTLLSILASHEDEELVTWMRRFNQQRLASGGQVGAD